MLLVDTELFGESLLFVERECLLTSLLILCKIVDVTALFFFSLQSTFGMPSYLPCIHLDCKKFTCKI